MNLRPALSGLLVVLSLAGCASGSNPEPSQKTLVVDEGAVRTTVTPGAQRAFSAPETKMWTALGAAYAALGFTVDVNDRPNHRMGVSTFYISGGRLNGQPVSYFANCGNGMTGPIADSRRVYFSLVTTVTAVDATHTTLLTDVSPTAVDVAGGSNDRISCGSTGALEAMLYDAVTHQLGLN